MKLFNSDQIKEIDKYTILNEPIDIKISYGKGGRTITQLVFFHDSNDRIASLFLPVPEIMEEMDLLWRAYWNPTGMKYVQCIEFTEKTSADWEKNLLRLNEETNIRLIYLETLEQFPVIF